MSTSKPAALSAVEQALVRALVAALVRELTATADQRTEPAER
jgi:hypothetical protein